MNLLTEAILLYTKLCLPSELHFEAIGIGSEIEKHTFLKESIATQSIFKWANMNC